jgi:hypothetical protein
MKFLTVSVLALATIAGAAATAYAGSDNVNDCHSISDSVYGIWGCR